MVYELIQQYGLFVLLALVAEILGTISGFGSSILFVPIASYFFDIKIVLGITAVFHVFSNVAKLFLFKKGISKDILLPLGIPAILFVIIGASITSYISTQQIDLLLNIALILLSIFLIYYKNKSMPMSNTSLILGGAISGFLAGLVGTGGAVRGITLSAYHLSKEVFVFTSALIDFGVDSSRAGIYIYQGYFQKQHIVLIPLLIFISVVGSYIGKQILNRFSESTFRNFVLYFILIIAVSHIAKYVFTNI